ncbi:hypothetical protein M514_03967 [Trichuris suis]|uniref:Uncharacterized protein n=1 Tax=Trichuris suis TaxID=68888 RepID=A0A085NSZ6_9BILA|nr:hypothetical protein M513_03967 [Trichuris suis]KFD72592.1 hypothetical protein M514_03967 [Trichuris suis]
MHAEYMNSNHPSIQSEKHTFSCQLPKGIVQVLFKLVIALRDPKGTTRHPRFLLLLN